MKPLPTVDYDFKSENSANATLVATSTKAKTAPANSTVEYNSSGNDTVDSHSSIGTSYVSEVSRGNSHKNSTGGSDIDNLLFLIVLLMISKGRLMKATATATMLTMKSSSYMEKA